MSPTWTMNIAWWIAAVEVPAITCLFVLIWRTRRELHDAVESARHRLGAELAAQREHLAAYKVEVANTYASIPALRDTESRLTSHLVRIEKKLDGLGFRTRGDGA